MNRIGESSDWSEHGQHGPAQSQSTQQHPQYSADMAGISEDDDFSKYLEVDNMDFGFPVFDDSALTAAASQDGSQQHHQQMMGSQQNFAMGIPSQQTPSFAAHLSNDAMQQQSIAQQSQEFALALEPHSEQQQQQQQHHHFSVPPTPNSTEMYPGSTNYIQHYHHYQHSHQRQKELMSQYGASSQHMSGHSGDSYTPMISPDVMPADTSSIHSMPQYTIPGAYLSPLTSPAMNPQNHPQIHSASYSQTHTAESSLQGSPILGIDFHNGTMALDQRSSNGFSMNHSSTTDSSERPRKTRKKGPTSRATAATSSPASGAVGRSARTTTSSGQKKGRGSMSSNRNSSNNLRSLEVAEDPSNAQKSTPVSGSSTAPNTREGTRSKSVSPQALPEARMPPPPKPAHSASSTPSIKGRPAGSALPPATPASLMRLQQLQGRPNGQQALTMSPSSPNGRAGANARAIGSPNTGDLGMSFEELKLPDAAAAPTSTPSTSLTSPAPSQSQARSLASSSASKTPASPASSAVNSPSTFRSPPSSTNIAPASVTGTPSISGAGKASSRGSRKRNSTSSNLVSPALMPKISPSIKPLLPERANGISDETHALLLASKSNYQNIIEGNHLPGVTYPSELSTNLTSKRTSHKIAEQGRRNRINTAIQEMLALLPPSFPMGSSATSGTTGSNSDTGSKDDPPSHQSDTAANPGAAESANGTTSSGPAAAGESATSATSNSKAAASAAQGNSKAATVESAIDYIKKLQSGMSERDAENEALRREIASLKSRLGLTGDSEASEAASTPDADSDKAAVTTSIPGPDGRISNSEGDNSTKAARSTEDAQMSG